MSSGHLTPRILIPVRLCVPLMFIGRGLTLSTPVCESLPLSRINGLRVSGDSAFGGQQMKLLAICMACIGTLASNGLRAQVGGPCDKVLVPNFEAGQRDYRLLQTYVLTDAESLYDRMSKEKSEGVDVIASYGPFGFDFGHSSNKKDFAEKARSRLKTEKFNMEVSEASSYQRQFVTAPQVEAWATCIETTVAAGGLILSAKEVDRDEKTFILTVSWVPPRLAPTDLPLNLSFSGGKFEEKSKITSTLKGREDQGYIVVGNRNARSVLVNANVSGFTYGIRVSLEKPVPPPPVKLVPTVVEIGENDRLPDGATILECRCSDENPAECGSTRWLSLATSPTLDIHYGQWSNGECDVKGTGWNARIGSCGKGSGTLRQRCTSLKVRVLRAEASPG